jgi:hypothetical protein
MVVWRGTEIAQASGDFGRGRINRRVCGVAQDSNTPIDRDRTRRPASLPVHSKPPASIVMAYMAGIKQRNKYVYVK